MRIESLEALLCPADFSSPVIADLSREQEIVPYARIEQLYDQALAANGSFVFAACPHHLEKDGHIYTIPESLRICQAQKSGLAVHKLDQNWQQHFFTRLSRSAFRSSFHLRPKDLDYIAEKSLPVIARHAMEFVKIRLQPAFPAKDGKQTPMKGHPAFVAAHATGTCCRGCLEKWHHISKGRELSQWELTYIVQVQMLWIVSQMEKPGAAVK